jgi:hypothetical protein
MRSQVTDGHLVFVWNVSRFVLSSLSAVLVDIIYYFFPFVLLIDGLYRIICVSPRSLGPNENDRGIYVGCALSHIPLSILTLTSHGCHSQRM